MKLEKLFRLTCDAAATSAGFNEHYDYAGEVAPELVLRLILQRQDLLVAIQAVLDSKKWRPDSPTFLILTKAKEDAQRGW